MSNYPDDMDWAAFDRAQGRDESEFSTITPAAKRKWDAYLKDLFTPRPRPIQTPEKSDG